MDVSSVSEIHVYFPSFREFLTAHLPPSLLQSTLTLTGQFLNLATFSCQLSSFLLDQQHIHTLVINFQIYLQHGPAVQQQST